MQGAWVRSLVRSHMLKLTHGAAKQISKINIKKNYASSSKQTVMEDWKLGTSPPGPTRCKSAHSSLFLFLICSSLCDLLWPKKCEHITSRWKHSTAGAWLPAHSPVSWKAQDLRLMWQCQKVEANLRFWNFPELPVSTEGFMWGIKPHLFLKPLRLWVFVTAASPRLSWRILQTKEDLLLPGQLCGLHFLLLRLWTSPSASAL